MNILKWVIITAGGGKAHELEMCSFFISFFPFRKARKASGSQPATGLV